MIASPAFEVIAPYRGGVGGGVDLFVVNQGLRIFDPSCIRLNPLKVNNLSKESMALSCFVLRFFGSWEQGKNGIGIYKSILCNELRIL